MSSIVRVTLPNGKNAGRHKVGSYIKIPGEKVWRRVNSDGTLTEVGDGTKGTYDYRKTTGRIRNEIAKQQKIKGKDPITFDNIIGKTVFGLQRLANYLHPLGWLAKATGAEEKLQNVIIRNLSGTSDIINEGLELGLGPFKKYYYDGKLHNDALYYDPEQYHALAPTIYTTNKWDTNRNLVNLYTTQDDTGFKPSEITIGDYADKEKYKDLPVYEGNFYGDGPLYLPTSAKQYFDSNLNRGYSLNQDKLIKGVSSFEGIDDVRNHRMNPRKFGDTYYVDFSDVWDIDRAGLNSQNYPFILNQRVPVIFTDDEEKINTRQNLSNWFNTESNWK